MANEMTQGMADIIGAANGDSGCRMVVKIMREDEPARYMVELRHCLFDGYVDRLDKGKTVIFATRAGIAARRAAIDAGMVRA
jgi:hypothetical protein